MNITNTVCPKRIKPKPIWIPSCLIIGLLFLIIFPADLSALSNTGTNNSCTSDDNCKYKNQWIDPSQKCQNGYCQCDNGTCPHFTTNQYTKGDSYFCGECGEIGSNCTRDSDCKYPGVCFAKYCDCKVGYLVMDVCVDFVSVSYHKESIILFSILVGIIVFTRLFKMRKTLKRLARRIICCGRQQSEDDNETVVGYNPDSQEKSAAYTISSREFNASSDDPDLEWALELSTQLANTSQGNQSDGARTRIRTHDFLRRNRNFRRGYNEYNQGSFSSRSSTHSNHSIRSSSESSTFSSAPSTPRSAMRRQTVNANLYKHKLRSYYTMSQETGNPEEIEEIIITRILSQKRFSSSSVEEFSYRQTGARPKRNHIYRLHESSSTLNFNSTDNDSEVLRKDPNSSDETTSNYSSTRSTFSREFNTDSNTTESLRTPSKSVTVLSASSSRRTKSLSLADIRKNKEILEDSHDFISEESSNDAFYNL